MASGSKSILSNRPDGFGYYYGFLPGDHRQLNVRLEEGSVWRAYVGSTAAICAGHTKEQAEELAIGWMKRSKEE